MLLTFFKTSISPANHLKKLLTKAMNPQKWIFVKSLLPFLFFEVCSASIIDAITPNQSIKDGDLLLSGGETFALGFFSPGNSNSRYVGIWYHKISEKTVVWVANRDSPIIRSTSGVLSINKDGNLIIYDDKNISFWQTNVSTSVKRTNYSARLMNSGNLALFHGESGSSSSSVEVAWQSFDHPTNAYLPGLKLGLDRRTGLYQLLTSWKSRDDPGTGEFSYRMDPGGLPQLFLFKGSARIWRTGPWMDDIWAGVPFTAGNIFNTSYVDNKDEVFVTYGVVNSSVVSALFLDELGSVQRLTRDQENDKWVVIWSAPKDECDNYGQCGANGYCDPNNESPFECTCLPGYEPRSAHDWSLRVASAGCVRKSGVTCEKGDGFVNIGRAKVPDTTLDSSAELSSGLSIKDCENKCLSNCSCSAYTTGNGGECMNWYGNLTDVRQFPQGRYDLYIRVDSVELARHLKKRSSFHGRMVAIVVTSAVVVLLLIISLARWLVKKRKKDIGPNIEANDQESIDLPIFDMATVATATNKFSITNKIGEGGFGPVYKGQLPTGNEIAVKCLSVNSKQGLNEFKNEVVLIAKLQHRNLVRLLGCCIHGERRMLIYEYMCNGSLDSLIFGPENTRKLLTWRIRLDIIIGISRGLLYLHCDSRLRVIHRDLKASNVLLDCEMNPKISDFGLAKAFGGDQSSAITKRVVGTYGYMSPEYAVDGLFSMKSDVFSFGVLILEIVSGKRNRSFHHEDHDLNLLGHAWKLWIEGNASELLDPIVEGSFSMSEVLKFIQVGLLCVQKLPQDRPTMSAVLIMLVTESAMLPQPKQPGFYIERNSNETNSSLLSESTASVNEVTITQLEVR